MTTTRRLQSAEAGFVGRAADETSVCPPALLEYIWYVHLAYAYLGEVWGIVIPAVGGGILLLLATSCLLNIGDQALRIYKPVAWAFYTGISVIVIQSLFYTWGGKALPEGTGFLTWLVVLIIIPVLSLRPGFLQRFALVAFAIGAACLPYINMRDVGRGIVRAWATGTGLSNPNALGNWFGACTVYFIFWGLQCRKPMARVASWVAAISCLYVVTLSISRAPLLGIVLACVVGFRSELKRSFVPLLSFVLLLCLVYASGVFDEEIGYYTTRGTEETGRGKLWPRALERIVHSPWIGVGLGDIGIPSARAGRFINPHNSLLHIWLGAGIVPVMCFLCYLARVANGTARIMQRMHVGETALLPPLVVYLSLEVMQGDYVFMSPWTVIVFGMAASFSHGMVAKSR